MQILLFFYVIFFFFICFQTLYPCVVRKTTSSELDLHTVRRRNEPLLAGTSLRVLVIKSDPRRAPPGGGNGNEGETRGCSVEDGKAVCFGGANCERLRGKPALDQRSSAERGSLCL